jgi:hypothetical protein
MLWSRYEIYTGDRQIGKEKILSEKMAAES